MTLCTNDTKTTGCKRFLIQFNIRTTTCHIGCDSNSTMNTGISDDLCFLLMELSIQNVMLNAFLGKHSGQKFGHLDGNRTD